MGTSFKKKMTDKSLNDDPNKSTSGYSNSIMSKIPVMNVNRPPDLSEDPNVAKYNEVKNEEVITAAILNSKIVPKFIDNKINYSS